MAWTGALALAFLSREGALLQAGRGALPSLAEAIAGEPIRGSWWGHAKGHLIFAVLSELQESPEVLSCKLVLGKVTLIHARLWPALFAAFGAGKAPGLDRVRQEHMPGGQHRNFTEPWPGWLPKAAIASAAKLSKAEARDSLPPALQAALSPSSSARGRAPRPSSPAKARRSKSARAKR